VTIVEGGRCGAAASAGNAGWVTPGLAAPIPAPGVIRQALRWMLDPDSPLLVRARLEPSFLAWMWRFARSCRPGPHRFGTAATLALGSDAPERFDELRADGIEFEMHEDGLLYLVRSARALPEWIEMYRDLEELGFRAPLRILDRDDVRELEPTVSASVAAGLLDGRERHVRPESLTAGLVRALRARGVEVFEDTVVERLVAQPGGWTADTSQGPLDADRVLVAAGVWTRELLAALGVRFPLEAAKGYSITVPRNGCVPKRPLYLTEIKVGTSPFDTGIRLAGTLELTGIDLTINRRRIRAIAKGASAYLHDWAPDGTSVEWAGLRPVAPDGLPIIGAVPGHEGLFVATGHAMNGITLAPSTGAALAPLIVDDELDPALEPLGVGRFG
jgi:D-amino-acid dehydrogenase